MPSSFNNPPFQPTTSLTLRCQTTDGLTLTGNRPKSAKYPKSLETLGDHILQRRLDLGLLQKDVAGQITVDPTTIRHWELNFSQPALSFIPKIIKFLGYNPFSPQATSMGLRIYYYRRIRGISQEKLARQIGINPGTLSKLERGRSKPFSSTIEKISNSLTFPGSNF